MRMVKRQEKKGTLGTQRVGVLGPGAHKCTGCTHQLPERQSNQHGNSRQFSREGAVTLVIYSSTTFYRFILR